MYTHVDIYAYIHTHTHICPPYTFALLSFSLSWRATTQLNQSCKCVALLHFSPALYSGPRHLPHQMCVATHQMCVTTHQPRPRRLLCTLHFVCSALSTRTLLPRLHSCPRLHLPYRLHSCPRRHSCPAAFAGQGNNEGQRV